jgi:hypothetical protein
MCPEVDSASKNKYQDFSWGKSGLCLRLTTYYPRSAERQENPGKPLGLSKPVAGDLYLYDLCAWKEKKRVAASMTAIYAAVTELTARIENVRHNLF